MDPKTVMLAGRDVPRIGLGTNRLTTASDHVEFVRQAAAAGIQHVDTAYLYSGGESEAAIGAAGITESAVVATKGGYQPGHGHPEVLAAQIEESLRRLRTDRIELYYLHKVHPETPIEDSITAIAEAKQRGLIGHVGVSNIGVAEIERAREIVPIAVVQNHYNVAAREHEDVVDYCTAEGIVFVPYFPLRSTGSSALAEIAQRHGATPQQIALAWLLKRSPVILPIPGTLSLEHAKENLGALDLELTDEEFAALAS
jgi:pyridoxine 4-dehydrogenase